MTGLTETVKDNKDQKICRVVFCDSPHIDICQWIYFAFKYIFNSLIYRCEFVLCVCVNGIGFKTSFMQF